MKEFEIRKNEAGQRLDKYLKKLLPQAGASFIYKMLRKKNISLNDKKATGGEHLALGDRVKVFFSDQTFDKFHGNDKELIKELEEKELPEQDLPVIYEDEDILIVNKPAGMLSQKSRKGDLSANEYILYYLLSAGKIREEDLATFHPSVCNRLDRNTSGILIAGKTLSGLQAMSRQLKERSVKKYYRCLVLGKLSQPEHLKGWLKKDTENNQVKILDQEEAGSQFIETEYQPIQEYPAHTLLEVHLITGRSHQIRAHLASVGHPILGDPKYGNSAENLRFVKETGIHFQLLHAYRLVFEDGSQVIAPLPDTFAKAEAYIQA